MSLNVTPCHTWKAISITSPVWRLRKNDDRDPNSPNEYPIPPRYFRATCGTVLNERATVEYHLHQRRCS